MAECNGMGPGIGYYCIIVNGDFPNGWIIFHSPRCPLHDPKKNPMAFAAYVVEDTEKSEFKRYYHLAREWEAAAEEKSGWWDLTFKEREARRHAIKKQAREQARKERHMTKLREAKERLKSAQAHLKSLEKL